MKYFSEKLNKLFDTEKELLCAEAAAENEVEELFEDINDTLGFACACMTLAMEKARDALALAAEVERTYGVEYKFNRGLIGDIAETYIVDMCRSAEEDDAYAEQCLEAWDDAWNGNNDSCACCGASDCDSDCDCDECVCELDDRGNCSWVFCSADEYRPFYSINLRNPIFQNFIHEYRNIAPMKKLAEEFPSIAEMFDRLESGND